MTTSCSSCGGRLQCAEGTNTVRCRHCGSRLLVTGRRRVVTYLVQHEIDARRAAIAAERAGRAVTTKPELCWVPYYRFTATELRFERDLDRSTVRGGPADPRWLAAWPLAVAFAGSEAPQLFGSPRTVKEEWRSPSERVRFTGRRIEKSLRACVAEIAPGSLGLRTSLLRATLLRADALPAKARIVACDVPAENAFRAALGPPRDDTSLRRTIVERVLSLVYHPVWLVPVRSKCGRLVVVDGFSGDVLAETSREQLDALLREPPGDDGALGLRPHVCPNCGNDLPLEQWDVVLHCGACERGWLLEGDRFDQVKFAVAAPPARVDERDLRHFPFWEVLGARPGERLWVPAFRHPSAKRLKDLAGILSRCASRFALDGHGRRTLSGCSLDAVDAAAIASSFLAGGEGPDGTPLLPWLGSAPVTLAAHAGRLVWLPFLRDAYGWREPVTGQALLPERSLGT